MALSTAAGVNAISDACVNVTVLADPVQLTATGKVVTRRGENCTAEPEEFQPLLDLLNRSLAKEDGVTGLEVPWEQEPIADNIPFLAFDDLTFQLHPYRERVFNKFRLPALKAQLEKRCTNQGCCYGTYFPNVGIETGPACLNPLMIEVLQVANVVCRQGDEENEISQLIADTGTPHELCICCLWRRQAGKFLPRGLFSVPRVKKTNQRWFEPIVTKNRDFYVEETSDPFIRVSIVCTQKGDWVVILPDVVEEEPKSLLTILAEQRRNEFTTVG